MNSKNEDQTDAASPALESPVHFLREEQTEPYEPYGEGAPQPKNVPTAKRPAGSPALPGSRPAGAEVAVHAGFPNPATDSDRKEAALSLDQLLIRHPSSTYLFRLSGHQWADEGIAGGDVAVVDRAVAPRRSDLVIAWQGDEFLLTRRYRLPNETAPWGTVTAVVHRYRQED